MLEVNSNAQFARRHRLRSSGDGALAIDGPEGFELTVAVVGGSPVAYSRGGGLGGTGLCGVGSQVTVKSRTVFQTAGEKSVVDIAKVK